MLHSFIRSSSYQQALHLFGKVFPAKRFPKGSPSGNVMSRFSPSTFLLNTSAGHGRRMVSHRLSSLEDHYPTRYVTEPAVLPRVDPVVWGRPGQDGLLTQADFDHYEKHGFVIINDVFSGKTLEDVTEDLISRRDEIEAQLAVKEEKGSIGESRSCAFCSEGGSRRLRSLASLFRHSPAVNKLARYPPLLASVKQILDDEVYMLLDHVNFHAAFHGEGFDWHSDFETWHSEDGLPKPRTVNVMVMLSKNRPHNGALMFMPGTHKYFISCSGGSPEDLIPSSPQKQYEGLPDQAILTEYGEKCGIEYCTGEPGTVVLFDTNIIHGSHGNMSHMDRCNLFLAYNAVGNKSVEPFLGTPPRPEFLSTRDPEWQKPITPLNI